MKEKEKKQRKKEIKNQQNLEEQKLYRSDDINVSFVSKIVSGSRVT